MYRYNIYDHQFHFLKRVLPESWQKLPVRQSPLHLISAAFTHLSQDIETSQLHHQLPQQQMTGVMVHYLIFQHLFHANHTVIRVQAFTQIEEPPAFTAAEGLCDLINRLELLLVRKGHAYKLVRIKYCNKLAFRIN